MSRTLWAPRAISLSSPWRVGVRGLSLRVPSIAIVLAVAIALPAFSFVATEAEAAVTPGFTLSSAPSSLVYAADAGEPSIGVNWNSDAVMFQSYAATYRIDVSGAAPVWTDASSPYSIFNLDPIAFTDPVTGRTFAGGLDGTCSALSYTDADGADLSWVPMTNSCAGAGWDHETIGGGPFAAPLTGVGYPNAVYYCSQTGLSPGPAWCALSTDGGISFNGGTYTWTTQCFGLHGHVKVGPDGWAYLPNAGCGATQGGARSSNNGLTWSVFNVPGIAKTDQFDPSIAVGGTAASNKAYFCARDGNGHPKIAVSSDHAATWSTPVDVGASLNLQNIEFPAMVAGDADRAACAFLGTTTAGDTQKSTFNGVWHLYIATTFDGGATWTTVRASSDPVQKGCIWAGGGSNECRNLLDFMDAAVTRTGRVVVGFADGCIGSCATGSATTKSSWAAIALQTSGSPLFAAFDNAAPTAPPAPTLTGTAGDRSNALTWTPNGDGGSAITTYKVYRDGSLVTTTSATSWTDASVVNGVTYAYQVSAVNAIGEGSRSNTVTLTPHAITAPTAPQGLTAAHSGGPKSGKIALSWSAPANDGGSAVTNYRIYRGTTSGGEVLVATVGNVLTFTDTGRTQGTTYFYQVAAVNAIGESPRSNEASAVG